LPKNVRVTHVSLFDRSLQGHRVHRQAGIQLPGPSGSEPWPHDVGPLFDRFVKSMEKK
jgi:carbamoyl-phosphate synthase small subunit